MSVWPIIVQVGQFQEPGFAKLAPLVNTSKGWEDVAFPRSLLLSGLRGTRSAVVSKLKKALAEPSAADLATVVLAGRLIETDGDIWWLASDTLSEDVPETAVSLTWLAGQLTNCTAGQLLVFAEFWIESSDLSGRCHDLLRRVVERAGPSAVFLMTHLMGVDFEETQAQQTAWGAEILKLLAGRAVISRSGVSAEGLANYLRHELPKTERLLRTGGTADDFMLLSSNPGMCQFDRLSDCEVSESIFPASGFTGLSFWGERRLPFEKLPGVRPFHTPPDRADVAAERFLQSLAGELVSDQLTALCQVMRDQYGLKRRDLELACEPGAGSVITPYFDVLQTIGSCAAALDTVIVRTDVVNIRKPEQVLSGVFDSIFGGQLQGLKVACGGRWVVNELIDQLEEQRLPAIDLQYDQAGEWCTIEVSGFHIRMRVTNSWLVVEGTRPLGPHGLLASFAKAQQFLQSLEDYPRLITD